MRVAILGTPVSSGNRGVLALGASLVNLCGTVAGRNEVLLMLGHRDRRPFLFRIGGKIQSVPIVNCRLSPRARVSDHLVWILFATVLYRCLPLASFRRALSRFTPWIAALREVDIVGDIRGGDSFSDIYGIRRFLDGFLLAWTVLLVKGRMVQFPQTFGPYKRPMARALARSILKRSSVVIARDERSRKVAQDLIGSKSRVWLSPDVAFSLDAIRPQNIQLDPPLNGPIPSGVIGVNVSGLMYNGGHTRDNMFGLKLNYGFTLQALITALLMEDRGELWLVPHTYGHSESVENDTEASQKVRAALPEALQSRVRIITGEYDCHEIKGIIGQCDFFIGSRMHACIAALSQGIPCVSIAYSRKFAGVFDTVGMGEWVVDGRDVGDEDVVSRVLELYRKRDEVRQELIAKAEEARRRLQDVFKKLFDVAAGTAYETDETERNADQIPRRNVPEY